MITPPEHPGSSDTRRSLAADWGLRFHAWALSRENRRYEEIVGSRKRALFAGAAGRVLELGAGGGQNFPYLSPGISWIGLEPNPYCHPHLKRRWEANGPPSGATILIGRAEEIPLPDSSVDCVIGTLVLCTVSDPPAVIREILRVLKPGGRYAFIEHVAAPRETGMFRVQRCVRPFWKRITGGCHPDRETWRAIEEGGFEELTIEHFKVSAPIVAPHIAGSGRKPRRKTRRRAAGARHHENLPLLCDLTCPHANFAPVSAVGACRRDQAIWCGLFHKLHNKHTRCIGRRD